MEKKFNELDSSRREVVITMTRDDLKPHYDEAYNKARPNIDMKGFRKGKVPMNVIKKYYGPQIEAEAIQDISTNVFNDVMKEEKLQVVGQPALKDVENKDGGLQFTIYYEVLPTFELGDYKSLTVKEPVHVVTDEEIDTEVKNLCINSGKLEDAEEILDEMHVAHVKLLELDEENKLPVIGSKAQETKIFLAQENVLPTLKENLMNKKTGDDFDYSPQIDDAMAPDKMFRVVIEKIEKLTPQEFDNEFVETYSRGRFQTTEEYREEIGFKIQEQWDQKTRQHMEDQIIYQLVDMHPDFDLPQSVVWDAMARMAEDIKKQYANIPQAQDLTVEEMAKDLRPLAERSVRWEIVRNRIMEVEDIKVEEHDVEAIAEMEAARTNSDKNALIKTLMNNQHFTQNILSKKIMDFLIDFTTTEEVSFEEYENPKDEDEPEIEENEVENENTETAEEENGDKE